MSTDGQEKKSISRLFGATLIGERVRKIRKDKGLTLDVLAEKSGVGKATLVYYELGEIEPSVLKLIKIARALGVSVVDLVQEAPGVAEASPPYGDPMATELLAAWGRLSEERKKQALEYLRFLAVQEKSGGDEG